MSIVHSEGQPAHHVNGSPDAALDAETWADLQASGAWQVSGPSPEVVEGSRVDWMRLLTLGAPEPAWLVEPIIPAGRMTALVASAKSGKSLLALELSLALATGRSFLGKPAGQPVKVLVLDFENSIDDLAERVEDMGYGLSDVNSLIDNLVYLSTPPIEAVNTRRGATQLLEVVRHENPSLVVVDTLSRAVTGDENSSEPYREAYRLAWSQLKRRGTAVLRLDHTGHEAGTRGRGSSAKRDDVDLSWTLKASKSGSDVVLSHHGTSRMGWVPQTVSMRRHEGLAPLHRLADAEVLPEGTEDWVAILDALDPPTGWGERRVREWLKEDSRLAAFGLDRPPRGTVLRAAVKVRRARSTSCGE